MQQHICFAHGQESGPWGTKIRSLAEVARKRGWTAESVDFQGMDDPGERISRLLMYCRDFGRPLALAGSSMGGYVATAVAAQIPVRGLFMLAPAFHVPGYADRVPETPACPITIVHGWRDDMVPWQGSLRYASSSRARLILVDGDHRLTANLAEIAAFFQTFLDELTFQQERATDENE